MTNGYQTPTAYSPEYYGMAAEQYQAATKPLYEREQARIKTALGGRGGLYGTPIYQQLGQLGQQRMTGLQQTMTPMMMQGAQFAAERPFKEAALTGMYGGQETLAGKQYGLQAELGRGGLAEQIRAAQAGETLAGQQYGLQAELGRGGLVEQIRAAQAGETFAGQQLAEQTRAAQAKEQLSRDMFNKSYQTMTPYEQAQVNAAMAQAAATSQAGEAQMWQNLIQAVPGLWNWLQGFNI